MKTQKQCFVKQRTPEYKRIYRLIGVEISNGLMTDIIQMLELTGYKNCPSWERKILKTRFKRLLIKVKKYRERLNWK